MQRNRIRYTYNKRRVQNSLDRVSDNLTKVDHVVLVGTFRNVCEPAACTWVQRLLCGHLYDVQHYQSRYCTGSNSDTSSGSRKFCFLTCEGCHTVVAYVGPKFQWASISVCWRLNRKRHIYGSKWVTIFNELEQFRSLNENIWGERSLNYARRWFHSVDKKSI